MKNIDEKKQEKFTSVEWIEESAEVEVDCILCDCCEALVGMIVIAVGEFGMASVEEGARLIRSSLAKWQVPTWVVGEERDAKINGHWISEAWVGKVWPEREPPRLMLATEFNPLIEKLAASHCDKKRAILSLKRAKK